MLIVLNETKRRILFERVLTFAY